MACYGGARYGSRGMARLGTARPGMAVMDRQGPASEGGSRLGIAWQSRRGGVCSGMARYGSVRRGRAVKAPYNM